MADESHHCWDFKHTKRCWEILQVNIREITYEHIGDRDDVNTWAQERHNKDKWRLLGIQISIGIDKILTAGHNISIIYNPLGRQTRHMPFEQEDESQDS